MTSRMAELTQGSLLTHFAVKFCELPGWLKLMRDSLLACAVNPLSNYRAYIAAGSDHTANACTLGKAMERIMCRASAAI